ncbi:hypothetical protein Acav_3033 [Paracidovorax avenae ATCC 19860]|uniref:Uncharacterized protein n=1 Tax=Paracidovorax avenae (strain ATCC 19860 / DSM 7227 / CCUG 15838 / JCM 20985 / LMG 2117 / NCPPB 1011) TaxID=643561 RepID=F0Q6I9_PARA1|nr:hypothetical protein [Paracidovorax avenae]ADX46935.1 hypothetical protein Acav_3033 [Paracidovorax avenae ATCC 19860]AVS66850.1 hypothetical protein C8245_15195 [Paracidovorax avenae]
MNEIFDLLLLLVLHWRIGVAVLAALITAVFLAATLHWFTGWYGILLVLLGLAGGMMWEAEWKRSSPR